MVILLLMLLLLLLLFIADPCDGITCAVADETCDGGTCKCGSAASCEGQTTGAFCDATNNVCKCSDSVDKCTDQKVCIDGQCGGYILAVICINIL